MFFAFARSWFFVVAVFLLTTAGVAAEVGSRSELPPVRPGSCTVVCEAGTSRVTGRVNAPDRIRSSADCWDECLNVCTSRRAPSGSNYRCSQADFEPLVGESRPAGVGSDGEDGGSAGANTQGARGARAGRTLSAASSCPDFHGVKDPLCGKSVAQLVGNVIKFLLGVAGALFLAMLVYGGVVWLTAGSSDRHEQARKTLVNAAAGVLIVIFSYTLVAGLVGWLGELGVAQENTGARLEEAEGGRRQEAGGATSSGTCNQAAVQTGCQALLGRVLDSGLLLATLSTAGCTQAATEFCRNIRSADACAAGCPAVCEGIRNVRESDIPVPVPSDALTRLRAINCAGECPILCRSAFGR